jgi:uncharacterized protein (DUF58 family)
MKVGDTGDATEFAGTRAYRPGDELRHIHWPTVARTGDLHVREYTQSSAESVVILILRNSAYADSNSWASPADGEAILRTAMALAIELFHRRIHLVVGDNFGEGSSTGIGYSQVNLQKLHDRMSGVVWEDPSGGFDFLNKLEVPGLETPRLVVFAVDPIDPDMPLLVSRQLSLSPSRVIVVTGEENVSHVPGRFRVLPLTSDAPERFFGKLVL